VSRVADRLPLPAPGTAPYHVVLVCLGNICRSPMADVVLGARLAAAGLDDEVLVESAGTGHWHVGDPMDRRAAALLTTHGYDASRHRARQLDPAWFDRADLVLAMDADNLEDVRGLAADAGVVDPVSVVRLFRDLDPAATAADRDVPDPYYGGDDGFAVVLAMVERTSDALVGELERLLHPAPLGEPAGG